eukprot:g2722.t1
MGWETTVVAMLFLAAAGAVAFYFLRENKRALEAAEAAEAKAKEEKRKQEKLDKERREREKRRARKKKARNKLDMSALAKANAATANKKPKRRASVPTHARFAGWVKGHTAPIVDFALSPDGQFCAASSDDRTLRVTKLADCLKKKSSPLYITSKTGRDSLSAICWAPAAAGPIVVGIEETVKNVAFYRCTSASEAKDKGQFKYKLKHLEKRSFKVDFPSTCNFIAIEQAAKKDLCIVAGTNGKNALASSWSMSGIEIGSRVKPKKGPAGHTVASMAVASDCAFLAASLGSSDANLYPRESSTGGFSRKPCMSLCGAHSKPITCLAFGGRASTAPHGQIDRALTCSLDGTFALWKIDVQHKFNEDAVKLFQSDSLDEALHFIAVSPNGKSVAVAGGVNGTTLWIYSLSNAGLHDCGEISLLDTIEDAAEGFISKLVYSSDSQFVAASCATSKIIFLWDVTEK